MVSGEYFTIDHSPFTNIPVEPTRLALRSIGFFALNIE
jgi:hypothetical protein